MPARVVVIGLDAAEATLLEQWADEGFLPTLAHLRKHGATSRLDNSLETLPGAIWPELTTGRSAGKLALFYHPAQLHTGEARTRPVTADDYDASTFYWNVASRAGRRVAVIDQPHAVGFGGLNGIQIIEWGLHDRHFNVATQPPELLKEVRARYGDHPINSCDHFHGGTMGGYLGLLDAAIEGARRKTALIVDVMAREAWDLLACAFGESHCAGHHFWRFRDPSHPAHRPDAPPELRTALRTVYQQLDAGIAAVIEAAGPAARVIVVASHGMGPKIGGPQLLPEVLHRLGLADGKPWHQRVGLRTPSWVRRAIKRASPVPIPTRLQMGTDSRYEQALGPRRRVVPLYNNRCGAMRLNLVGREPFGSVQPGAEAEALLAELRNELLSLRAPVTGEPIVKRVVTATEAFGPDHHPDVPDLMIVFRTDLGFLTACTSARVGLVQVPVSPGLDPRSGDHWVQSRLWAIGPGCPQGSRLRDANVLDLAPTVLELLDVDVPSWIDGHPLPDLIAAPSALPRALAGTA